MEQHHWAYANQYRAAPHFLLGIAVMGWVLGAVFEKSLPGAIAASGGLVIGITTPLFVFALAKQHVYELDGQLAVIALKREINLGKGIIERFGGEDKSLVENAIVKSTEQLDPIEFTLLKQREFSKKLYFVEAGIFSISSIVWSLGEWIGNLVFHCGRASC